MPQLKGEFISAILQVLVLTLIPFIFYLLRKNKSETFSQYIGIYKPPINSIFYVIGVSFLFLIAGIGLILFDEGVNQAALSPLTVAGKIRLMGLNMTSVSVLLFNTLIKTSLSEEIFFRGFLGKRFTIKLGFKLGNFLQAVIFGLVHLILFWLLIKPTFIPLIIIFVFTGTAGWIIGYIKEKYANGSIIPGWVAHGLGNTLSTFIIAFML